mmetsp:Transcript_7755/g.22897  ORF Transcript_7755/g.22897 Transcript_7755/m.22897 type:complete len:821 (+) Transcript_7755:150-2612(+)
MGRRKGLEGDGGSVSRDESPVAVADMSHIGTFNEDDLLRLPDSGAAFAPSDVVQPEFEPIKCHHGYWKPRRDLVLQAHDWLKGEISNSNDNTAVLSEIREGDTTMKDGIDLTIVSGAGLATMHGNDRGPFVVACITGGSSMTTHNRDPSDSPTWNTESFLTCEDWSNAVLVFEVFQRNALHTKMIGYGLLDLSKYNLTTHEAKQSGKRIDVVLTEKSQAEEKLRNPAASANMGTLGNIRIKVQYAKRDPRKAGVALSQKAQEKVGKLVTIDVVEARYLSPMDQNGKADPYCVVSIGQKSEKTKPVKETLEPEWRERFDFMVSNTNDPIVLKVFDEDAWRSDDLMGLTTIPLDMFELDVPTAKWYNIEDADGTDVQGQVFCNITVSSLWSEPRIITSHDRKQVAGVLTLWVKEARGLKAADVVRFGTGKSDPFCVVECGSSRYRTRTIFSTLRPKWNRKFEFMIDDVYSLVNITVNDEDKGQEFDFLGAVTLSLFDLPTGETWLALKSQDRLERAQGDILVEAVFTYNQYKAMTGLLKPRAKSYVAEKDPKFTSKKLNANIKRVKDAVGDLSAPFKFLGGISSGKCGAVVGVLFTLVWYYFCMHAKLWHVPWWIIGGLYVERYRPKPKKALAADEDGNVFDVQYEDSDSEDGKKPKKKKKPKKTKGKGLFKDYQTFKRLAKDQYGTINDSASWLERVKNVFLWHQVTITWAVVILLLVTALTIYLFAPMIKYMLLIGGYIRFGKGFYAHNIGAKKKPGKRKRKGAFKHQAQGNPITNVLMRVPSDEDIAKGYHRFRPATKTRKEKRMEKMLSKIAPADGFQ